MGKLKLLVLKLLLKLKNSPSLHAIGEVYKCSEADDYVRKPRYTMLVWYTDGYGDKVRHVKTTNNSSKLEIWSDTKKIASQRRYKHNQSIRDVLKYFDRRFL